MVGAIADQAVPRQTMPARGALLRLWWAALSIGAAHLFVKALHLGASSLWLDEAVAVHTAQLGPLSIVTASCGDTTPPVYYLVLAAVERLFGVSEVAVRFPSVLFSAAAGALLLVLSRKWFGPLGSWIASALYLVSDVNYHYARQARPYAMVSMLCILSFLLLVRALERPARSAWAALATVNALMLFTHYASVLAVVGQALACLLPWRGRRAVVSFGVSHSPVALAYLGWVVPLMTAGQQHKMEWLPSFRWGHLWAMLNWFAGSRPGGPAFLVLAAMATIALLGRRVWGGSLAFRIAIPVISWAFLPVAMALALSPFVRFLHARYLLYVTPGFVLFWTLTVLALPTRLRALGAALVSAITLAGFGRSMRTVEADWRQAAERVQAIPSARVLLAPPYEAVSFAYYFDRSAFTDPAHTWAILSARGVRTMREGTDLDLLDLDGVERVVLVLAGPAREGNIERLVASRGFEVKSSGELTGIRIAECVRPALEVSGTR